MTPLPSIADFFAGIPYYFAAYLIADRQTRIYGSRLIPLALAVAGSIVSSVSYYFIGSVLISLLITLLLAFTAEGSAISHGFTLLTPRRSRLALFLTLIFGFSLLSPRAAVKLNGKDSFQDENPQFYFQILCTVMRTARKCLHNSKVNRALTLASFSPDGISSEPQPQSRNTTADVRHFLDTWNTHYTDLSGHEIAPPDAGSLLPN